MPKWTVDLVGDQADLEALAALGGGVVRDGANFVFQLAEDLDTLTEARAVEQAVVQRIEVLKGLLRVMTGDKRVRTVTTTGGLRREENGNTAYILVTEPAHFELQGGIVGDTGKWLSAALRDPSAGWALQLFAGEPTPASLYKVFEVIRSEPGVPLAERGWTTPKDITRFTRTVNSPQHLGVDARHGVPEGDPLAAAHVMSVREMRDFVRRLLERWLETK